MRIENLSALALPTFLDRTHVGFGFMETEKAEAALVRRCEQRFAEVQRLPASHSAIGVSNGTDALVVSLLALDIGAGDPVIVPGQTWKATAQAVDDVNGEPVLLDIDPATNTLDPNVVEAYLEDCLETGKPMPRAIIVVHLHDHAADMDRFPGIARRFGLFLIEDCAQAHGAAWRDRALGSFGTLGTFSTQRTKPLAGVKRADDDRWECPTGSEGGFVVTGVPLLDIRVRSGADCGRRVEESVLDPAADVDELTDHWRTSVDALNLGSKVESGNNRLPASVAERLLDQMDWFEQEHQERTATLKALDRRLPEFVGVSLLAHQPQLTRRVTHMFAMRFEPEEFAGMDSELFRQVLMPLLGGLLVDKPYDTLGGGEPGYRSPVYDPHAMRRYNTTPEHWEAIDPSRAHLPACHDAMKHVVVIENTALREPGFPDALVAALQWMRRRAAWLVEQARA